MVGRYFPTRAEKGLIRPNSAGPLNRPDRLCNVARVVIGLDNMGFDYPADMADAIRLVIPPLGSQKHATITRRRRRFVAQAKRVLASRHPVVIDALLNGLPRGSSGVLPNGASVRCETCGSKCSSVPCIRCSKPLLAVNGELSSGYELNASGEMDLMPLLEDSDERPLIEPLEATEARPGTLEKLEVMRMRMERGESCFHPDDPRVYHQIDRTDCYGAMRVVGGGWDGEQSGYSAAPTAEDLVDMMED